jgi:hypothetical protein
MEERPTDPVNGSARNAGCMSIGPLTSQTTARDAMPVALSATDPPAMPPLLGALGTSTSLVSKASRLPVVRLRTILDPTLDRIRTSQEMKSANEPAGMDR